MSRKNHWQTVYENLDQSNPGVGWYQAEPQPSLKLIKRCELSPSANIIDIGGGESRLVDFLLQDGFGHISVLDLSATALQQAQKRLGHTAGQVKWIVADVTEFKSEALFDCWHDRAALHFLTDPEDIKKYVEIATELIRPDGWLIIGTFSECGPRKCSGLPVQRYSAVQLKERFAPVFTLVEQMNIDHHTPSGAGQNYTFCRFRKSH